jgi:large subunit ribosomal protein L4
MIKIDINTIDGSKNGTVSLRKTKSVSSILISNTVLANLSNKRQSIAHTKTKGEVRGGGKKPWKQKGTGQARAGSSRSPIWVGGGTVFGPRKERNFYKRINRKQKLVVINDILAKKAETNNFKILEKIDFPSGKTKDMVNLLSSLGVDGSTILVLDKNLSNSEQADKVYNAGRNISFLTIISLDKLNAFMAMKYKWIVMTKQAFEDLESKFGFIKEEAKVEDKPVKAKKEKAVKKTVKKVSKEA